MAGIDALPLQSFTRLSPAEQVKTWDQALARLARIAGHDEGYFVLAVHSLIEAWLNSHCPEWAFAQNRPHFERGHQSFRDKIDQLRRQYPEAPWHGELWAFAGSYADTTAVRHHFASLKTLEARRSASRLVLFSHKAGLGSLAALARFESIIDGWSDGIDLPGLLCRLKDLEARASAAEERPQALDSALAELARNRQAIRELEDRLGEQEVRSRETDRQLAEASRLKQNDQALRDKDREQRQAIWQLKEEVRRITNELASRQAALAYLEELQSLHQASRTQLDYQRTLLRLSAEQAEILSSFKPDENFLVRGGAGTGKTLVLIRAIQAIREDEAGKLGYDGRKKVLMLTYTKTLIRYGRYLGELVARGKGADEIQTVDAWMLGLGQALLPAPVQVLHQGAELAHAGLAVDGETWDELESFVWARGLSRQEYVVEAVPRHGRKHAIPASRRDAVWQAGERLFAAMREKGVYSRCGLRRAILARLDQAGDGVPPACDVIAVDEVQDLAPVDLLIIRRLAGRSVIMAGDTQQSLYQAGFSFRSVGIGIEHRSRILTRNYRNTRPIEELANAFLSASAAASSERTATTAHREGLPPKLALYPKKTGWAPALAAALDYYRQVLGYGDESIAVLHPGLDDHALADLSGCVHGRGSALVDIRNNENWIDAPGIRLSTIHSAKGLDFPVVILLLPRLHADRELEDRLRHAQEASLIYVGLTRALEGLTVILPEETASTCLLALKEAFAGGSAG